MAGDMQGKEQEMKVMEGWHYEKRKSSPRGRGTGAFKILREQGIELEKTDPYPLKRRSSNLHISNPNYGLCGAAV